MSPQCARRRRKRRRPVRARACAFSVARRCCVRSPRRVLERTNHVVDCGRTSRVETPSVARASSGRFWPFASRTATRDAAGLEARHGRSSRPVRASLQRLAFAAEASRSARRWCGSCTASRACKPRCGAALARSNHIGQRWAGEKLERFASDANSAGGEDCVVRTLASAAPLSNAANRRPQHPWPTRHRIRNPGRVQFGVLPCEAMLHTRSIFLSGQRDTARPTQRLSRRSMSRARYAG